MNSQDYIHQHKTQYLPIIKEEYGYVQKTQYHQPDLYHEEVIELDSPYASVIEAGTQVFSFLLLGDQNAGKSTFLHSFTYHFDANFLTITSILPILTSSFINTRFYFENEAQKGQSSKIFPNMTAFKPMDEIPFIDTDVARGTFLITKEDFLFFLDEYSIPIPQELKLDTVYVITQFIEIGGDHLDSLMQYEQSKNEKSLDTLAPSLVDILKRSHDLLLQATKTIYFLNAETLFRVLPNRELVLHEDSVRHLVARLCFLNATFKDTHQMLFYLSRTPPNASFSSASASTSLDILQKALHTSHTPSPPLLPSSPLPSTVCQFLHYVLQSVAAHEQWKNLKIVDVYPATHINENDGSLNADEVVNTLVRCYQQQMVHSHVSPDLAVVDQILRCYKEEALEPFLEHAEQQGLQPDFYPIYWISKIVFRDYLLEEDEVEVPHPVLIQKYPEISKKMAKAGVLVQYFKDNHSNISLQLNAKDGKKFVWRPPIDTEQSTQRQEGTENREQELGIVLGRGVGLGLGPGPSEDVVVRFPHYAPLFKFIESNFIRNVPNDFWTLDKPVDLQHFQNAAIQLEQMRPKLETEILDRFAKLFLNFDSEDVNPYLETLFWLIEDWTLCVRILQHELRDMRNLEFSQEISIKSEDLQKLISAGHVVEFGDANCERVIEFQLKSK